MVKDGFFFLTICKIPRYAITLSPPRHLSGWILDLSGRLKNQEIVHPIRFGEVVVIFQGEAGSFGFVDNLLFGDAVVVAFTVAVNDAEEGSQCVRTDRVFRAPLPAGRSRDRSLE
jgi:hypothetical protein